MKKSISRDRLKELRLRSGLNQARLAKRSGISKDTISRIERGELPGNRRHTLVGLAEAFNVDPGVLTGELPLPPDTQSVRARKPASVKVASDTLNALYLVSRRYKVPMDRVVELAPLLFVLAAEGSLESRRTNLERLKAAYHALGSDFPHLNAALLNEHDSAELFEAEAGSIAENDIFAKAVPPSINGAQYFPFQRQNPFSFYLQEQCSRYSEDLINYAEVDQESATYWVCEADALKIAAGDEDAQEWIIRSEFLLSKMPKHLWAEDALNERLAWMREAATTRAELHADFVEILDIENEGGQP